MKCPHCGQESASKFCIYCGTPLPDAKAESPAAQPPDNATIRELGPQTAGAGQQGPAGPGNATVRELSPGAGQQSPPLPQNNDMPHGSAFGEAMPPPPAPQQGFVPGVPYAPGAAQPAMPPPQKPKLKKWQIAMMFAAVPIAAFLITFLVLWLRGGTAPQDVTGRGPSASQPAIPEEQVDVEVDIRQIDTRNFPEVTLYAEMTNENSEAFEVFAPKDMVVYEIGPDGEEMPAKVTEVFRVLDQGFVSINLVMDRSGSMEGTYEGDYTPMFQAQNAATLFVDKLNLERGDTVAVTSFNDMVYVDQEFTNDAFSLRNSISSIRPSGQTALYDALYSALLHTQEQTGAKCVIAFTDGLENASVYSMEEVAELSGKLQIPVYIIGAGNEYDEATLRQLAQQCGGAFYHAALDDLESALSNIYASILDVQKEWFGIRYTSPSPDDKATERQVMVEMQQTQGYRGNSQISRFVPVPIYDSSFAGTYGSVEKQLIYEMYLQYITKVLRQASGQQDPWRMAQFAANMPAVTGAAAPLSAEQRAQLDLSWGGIAFSHFIPLDSFNTCMQQVFGSAAPHITAETLLRPYEVVSNPNTYTYTGYGNYAAYSSALGGVVLGLPDTSAASRVLNYVSSATQTPGGGSTAYNADLRQYTICRGDYVENTFRPSTTGEYFVVLDKYGETAISEELYNLLMNTADYEELQRAIARLETEYGASGLECRVSMSSGGNIENAVFTDVSIDTAASVTAQTPQEALNAAGTDFRVYYESFLLAIDHFDAGNPNETAAAAAAAVYMENCTEPHRARQQNRITEFNKLHTFVCTGIFVDLDTLNLSYENNHQTLRFRVRCEFIWTRRADGVQGPGSSVQDVEMFYDEALGRWIVANTHYDGTMPMSVNTQLI